MSRKEFSCRSLEDTRRLASSLGAALSKLLPQRGVFIGLAGELGGGKTTFVREVAAALGIKEPVSSPTFVLEHQYRQPSGMVVEHWDLYRLKNVSPEELVESIPANHLRIVEWIDRAPELQAQADLLLRFTVTGEQSREIEMSCPPGSPLNDWVHFSRK